MFLKQLFCNQWKRRKNNRDCLKAQLPLPQAGVQAKDKRGFNSSIESFVSRFLPERLAQI